MWKIYALAPEGIAIKSTIGDINKCLRPHNSGRVIYYDPSHDVRSPTIFSPHEILFKRGAFSWELEYRFWFDDEELVQSIEAGEEIREASLSRGRQVIISDMQQLIKKIIVAPDATDEFIDQVHAVCVEHWMQWV